MEMMTALAMTMPVTGCTLMIALSPRWWLLRLHLRRYLSLPPMRRRSWPRLRSWHSRLRRQKGMWGLLRILV